MKRLKLLQYGLILLMSTSLFGNKISNNFEKSYYLNGGKLTKELKTILLNDEFYKKAIDVYNEKKAIKKEYKDVETGNKAIATLNVPEWGNSYGYFIKSATNYKNPISAYAGLHIINSFIGKKNALKEYKMFSKVLYEKNKSICSSYLNYAEIFINGIYEKKNKEKAITILEEGLKKACTNGWKKQVVMSKLWGLRR